MTIDFDNFIHSIAPKSAYSVKVIDNLNFNIGFDTEILRPKSFPQKHLIPLF